MRTKFYFIVALLFATGLFIYSCTKEGETDTDTQAEADNGVSDEAVSQIFSTVNHYGINEEGIRKSLNTDSATVTITPALPDTTTFPKTMVIDFKEGVQGPEGALHKGKVTIVFSGHWRPTRIIAGTYADITFENYFVKRAGEWVERKGKFKVTYDGKNSDGGPNFTIVSTDAILVFANNEQILWNGTKTIKWTQGFGDADVTNDVYYTAGEGTGTDKKGRNYTVKITKDIKSVMSCDYINVEGTFEITPDKLSKRVVDFGAGDCDNKIVVTVNGISLTVEI